MFWATMETRHFSFDAFGSTKHKCFHALVQGIKRHCKQYKEADLPYLLEIAKEEFHCVEISDGDCLRDRDHI